MAGGAINWRYGAPNITDCLFEKNSAPKGGAIYLNKSSENTLVSNCDFINNTADVGGAIYNNNSTDGIVSGCNFIENSALNGNGGAIYMYFAGTSSPYWSYDDGTAINCNFIKNSAENGNGGAIYWSLSEKDLFPVVILKRTLLKMVALFTGRAPIALLPVVISRVTLQVKMAVLFTVLTAPAIFQVPTLLATPLLEREVRYSMELL